ncbi:MAG: hypothetical protein E7G36_00115 [Peptoniphilus rhinitidis]|uniref:hypothetical protein n=1 Tax=Peptoniphilus rhinitidis TaxID=1175452 RepID=UPI00290288D2|nr:hypothetical protein [Peptoniphilus rhinitidis]MDU2109041.1 hypothetical protein [Peptoniphilus lacydonensis]MDU3750107.1 hypothetical protein [Peptoniphilus rhinitidis]
MNKKVVLMSSFLISCSLLLTGCGNKKEDNIKEKTKIVIDNRDDKNNQKVEKLKVSETDPNKPFLGVYEKYYTTNNIEDLALDKDVLKLYNDGKYLQGSLSDYKVYSEDEIFAQLKKTEEQVYKEFLGLQGGDSVQGFIPNSYFYLKNVNFNKLEELIPVIQDKAQEMTEMDQNSFFKRDEIAVSFSYPPNNNELEKVLKILNAEDYTVDSHNVNYIIKINPEKEGQKIDKLIDEIQKLENIQGASKVWANDFNDYNELSIYEKYDKILLDLKDKGEINPEEEVVLREILSSLKEESFLIEGEEDYIRGFDFLTEMEGE